jgi:hypothetical protein
MVFHFVLDLVVTVSALNRELIITLGRMAQTLLSRPVRGLMSAGVWI